MKKLTVILGPLEAPLLAAMAKRGKTPSQIVRTALAKDLGVEEPTVPIGSPVLQNTRKARKQGKLGAKIRHGKKSEK